MVDNSRAHGCACVIFYCIQDSRKFSICGKRRKCGKPNSHASFILQATSDEMRVLFYYGHLCFFLSRFSTLQSPLTPFAWGRNSCVRSFHSRDLACLDYQNISAPIGRNICLADAFLCLLLPNDIRVLFHEKHFS